MTSHRRTRSLFVTLAVMAVVVACGSKTDDTANAPGSKVDAGTTTPSVTEPPTTAAPVPVFPLRGIPMDDPVKAQRPALVVKIDNVDQYSRPQAGINQADIVYEEKIEGPISRFAAIFHSTDADDLGPVRSGRSTDVAIVSTLSRPLYAFSGANEVFIKKLRAAPLIDIGYDVKPNSYDRRKGRPAPDDVFTTTQRLWELTPPDAVAPNPHFTYRKAGDPYPVGAVEVTSLSYDFGLGPVGQPVTFTWDPGLGGWARDQKGSAHVDAAGVRIAPPNVIVQFTPYHDTGLYDLSKTPVPEAELVGSGEAWVFIDGRAIKATWRKPDNETITTFTAADDSVIALNPGQTWIALVPTGGGFSGIKTDGTPLT
jgi:hypothetical protein